MRTFVQYVLAAEGTKFEEVVNRAFFNVQDTQTEQGAELSEEDCMYFLKLELDLDGYTIADLDNM